MCSKINWEFSIDKMYHSVGAPAVHRLQGKGSHAACNPTLGTEEGGDQPTSRSERTPKCDQSEYQRCCGYRSVCRTMHVASPASTFAVPLGAGEEVGEMYSSL